MTASKPCDAGLSWRWSRYFYETEDHFDLIDGLMYLGAWNDGCCVLLFERAKDGLDCTDCSLALADPRLRDDLLRIAYENHLRLP